MKQSNRNNMNNSVPASPSPHGEATGQMGKRPYIKPTIKVIPLKYREGMMQILTTPTTNIPGGGTAKPNDNWGNGWYVQNANNTWGEDPTVNKGIDISVIDNNG